MVELNNLAVADPIPLSTLEFQLVVGLFGIGKLLQIWIVPSSIRNSFLEVVIRLHQQSNQEREGLKYHAK